MYYCHCVRNRRESAKSGHLLMLLVKTAPSRPSSWLRTGRVKRFTPPFSSFGDIPPYPSASTILPAGNEEIYQEVACPPAGQSCFPMKSHLAYRLCGLSSICSRSIAHCGKVEPGLQAMPCIQTTGAGPENMVRTHTAGFRAMLLEAVCELAHPRKNSLYFPDGCQT